MHRDRWRKEKHLVSTLFLSLPLEMKQLLQWDRASRMRFVWWGLQHKRIPTYHEFFEYSSRPLPFETSGQAGSRRSSERNPLPHGLKRPHPTEDTPEDDKESVRLTRVKRETEQDSLLDQLVERLNQYEATQTELKAQVSRMHERLLKTEAIVERLLSSNSSSSTMLTQLPPKEEPIESLMTGNIGTDTDAVPDQQSPSTSTAITENQSENTPAQSSFVPNTSDAHPMKRIAFWWE